MFMLSYVRSTPYLPSHHDTSESDAPYGVYVMYTGANMLLEVLDYVLTYSSSELYISSETLPSRLLPNDRTRGRRAKTPIPKKDP